MSVRNYSLVDSFLIHAEKKLGYLCGNPSGATRESPSVDEKEKLLSQAEKRRSVGFMRVNYAGEVCAQALYEGQALMARNLKTKETMQSAADEEIDHLAWCAKRIDVLEGHVSFLNPLWYAGSFSIGVCAAALGDKWSLGFLAETERQVVMHLESHLEKLPINDEKSRIVLEQMIIDEAKHATMAVDEGGAELPWWVKKGMGVLSKVMTKTAYWI